MRLSVIALLLLGTAGPAFADPDAEPSREQRIEQRAAEREARSEERAQRFERAEPAPREERPEPRFQRPEPRFERAEAPPEPPREERRAPRFERSEAPPPPPPPSNWRGPEQNAPALERLNVPAAPAQVDAPPQERRREWSSPDQPGGQSRRPTDSVEAWRWQERENARRERRERDQAPPPPPVLRSDVITPPVVAPRPGDQVRGADRRQGDILRDRIAAEGWRQDWRRDRRYDWRRHRDYDRRRFRVGIYIDPFGWSYRRWDLGWTLPSRFYSSRYWISDPWYYRLPPVYGPYRWIRYYDDVLLVDLRTGRVVDRIRNFFW